MLSSHHVRGRSKGQFSSFSPLAGLERSGCTEGLGISDCRGSDGGSATVRVPGSCHWTARQGSGQKPASTQRRNPPQRFHLDGFKYSFMQLGTRSTEHKRIVSCASPSCQHRGWGRTELQAAGLWRTTGQSWAVQRALWCMGTSGRPATCLLNTHSPVYTQPPPGTEPGRGWH